MTMLSLSLCIVWSLQAQRSLKGQISNIEGEALIGATIIEEGTNNGTITDYDGQFEIKIPDKKVNLLISYTGFENQTIEVEPSTEELNITLITDVLQLQDIVVTANKKAESVQKVPMAITTLSPQQLRRSGAKVFRDYASGIANLSFGTQGSDGGGRFSNEISIRGISGVGTTAMYLDETPLPESIDPNLIDVARVEVLKGPQGTLYGSATMGGAIKVITNQANPLQTEGSIGLSAASVKEGDFDYGLQGVINVPLNKKLALRATGYYDFESGVYDRVVNKEIDIINSENPLTYDFYDDEANITTDGCPGCSREDVQNIDDERNYGFNASLGFYPNENISIIPKVIYQGQKGDGYDFAEVDVNNFEQQSNTGLDESFQDEWIHYSLGMEVNLGQGKLVSSTSYLDRKYTEIEDVSDINTIWWIEYETEEIADWIWASNMERSVATNLFQQELRYQSEFDGKFNFLAGAFYNNEQQDWLYLDQRLGKSQFLLSDNAFDPDECPDCTWDYDHVMNNPDIPWYLYDGFFENSEFALFGQFYYDITPALKFTLGLRYFNVSKRKDITENGADFGFFPLDLDDKNSEDGINPKFNLTYQLDKDKLIYATAARGYRLGDINENLPSFCLEEVGEGGFPRFYESDYIWNYELGFKSTWANNRIITNAAIFYNDWGNLQQYRFLDCGWGFTSNVGSAHSAGVELDVKAKLSKEFQVNLGLGLLDPTIDEGGDFLDAEAGDNILYTPNLTANVSATYSKAISDQSNLYVTANLQHVGERYGTYYPEEETELVFGAYTFLNARIGMQFNHYEFSIFGNNLTNTQANFGDIQSFAGNLPGRPRYATNRPITVGVQARYYF